ncbi:MAG: DUF2203 domain-containing protein [Gammaproteobacteria bacterium]|nr:DUF2203 domain-containing protein [Gammaproteobacteria bacterium]NIR84166.1 DUF2203 domain-containing protein [Gammaproteobacteria bacterium]NIR89478.1 DUF2203 domain-containing protein [Gammaproteobacteria bacterium]NIU05321.1 DUF2203 domain-containing protein [Gammaproteobacteria bacterium]NIV52261.1 DUF2203 family protein [Gammaproteobacteria bacterium]
MSTTANETKRYFSVEEANGMIPTLEIVFGRLLQINTQIRAVYRRLADAGYAPSQEDFVLAPRGASQQVINELASLRTLIDALKDQIAELQRAGCVVKDIDRGLVDWYAYEGGREIFLCWELGEKQINYWHEIDAGYAGRRPVSELHDSV